jgi:hypothetical protein
MRRSLIAELATLFVSSGGPTFAGAASATKHKLPKRLALSALAATLAISALVAGPASADGVQHLSYPISLTSTSARACGFPIIRNETGTLNETIRTTSSGTVIDSIHFVNYRITFTNPANGKSITSVRGFTERDIMSTNGTDTHYEAGLVSHLIIPGQGAVAINAGHLVSVFDANGNLVSVTDSGPHDGPIAPYACAYLQ